MSRNSAKWDRLVEARSRGKSWTDAAEEAGYSPSHAKRLGQEQEFKAAVAARISELRDEDRAAFLEHRRDALRMARFALAKEVELAQSGNAPAAVVERVNRTLLEHARGLWPSLEVAELAAELAELEGLVGALSRGGSGGNGHHAQTPGRLAPW